MSEAGRVSNRKSAWDKVLQSLASKGKEQSGNECLIGRSLYRVYIMLSDQVSEQVKGAADREESYWDSENCIKSDCSNGCNFLVFLFFSFLSL